MKNNRFLKLIEGTVECRSAPEGISVAVELEDNQLLVLEHLIITGILQKYAQAGYQLRQLEEAYNQRPKKRRKKR